MARKGMPIVPALVHSASRADGKWHENAVAALTLLEGEKDCRA
jgi:hypothetical protein